MSMASTATLRQERATTAHALRSEGLKYREIAERMRLSISYVADLIKDPTGEAVAARKASYVQPCPSCGRPAPSTGSDGKNGPPRRCRDCAAAFVHENRYWTPERIVAWIKDYVAEHGEVPPSTLLVTREASFGTETIRREFGGSWGNAVRAAGFEPLRRGGNPGPLGRDHPTIEQRLRFYAEGMSLAEIAERQGVTLSAIKHTISRYVGGTRMSSRLSPTAVLEREQERAQLRIESLKREIEDEERNVAGLTAALEALAAVHANTNGRK